MNQKPRTFTAAPAVRKQVPLLMGIMSPSGGGKTYSALRLATGMQQVMGGDIYGVDTENNRMLHYADQFKFKHVPFAAPFGSLAYLDCLKWCSAQGGRIIIVDSMTHEHIGEGGYLETAENTITRILGDKANSWSERQKVQMLGWATAGPLRQKMIEGIKQLDGCFIFCFRAKEKTKPVRNKEGKTDIIDMGFMPIAGEEWVYEMAVNCMLEPRSDGIPTWRSDHVGERLMMKLPTQFKGIFAEEKPLDENIGRALAEWARGGSPATRAAASPPQDEAADDDDTPTASEWDQRLSDAAKEGTAALQALWSTVPPDMKQALKVALDRRHKPEAAKADKLATAQS